MPRLPFDPEPVLRLFMSEENAGSLVGDLEERFQCTCGRKGLATAMAWFGWALFLSIPPILLAALKARPSKAAVCVAPFAIELIVADSIGEYTQES